MFLCQSISKKSFETLFFVNEICDLCFNIEYVYIGYTKVYIIYAKDDLHIICLISTFMYYEGIDMNVLFTYNANFLENEQISTYLDFDMEKVFIIGENSLECRNMTVENY